MVISFGESFEGEARLMRVTPKRGVSMKKRQNARGKIHVYDAALNTIRKLR
jgi:hypothetical protein